MKNNKEKYESNKALIKQVEDKIWFLRLRMDLPFKVISRNSPALSDSLTRSFQYNRPSVNQKLCMLLIVRIIRKNKWCFGQSKKILEYFKEKYFKKE